MTKTKIKTKAQALSYLNQLLANLDELKQFVSQNEYKEVNLFQSKLIMMSNSIRHSESFFNSFFKDKTEEEVKQWIEKEAEKW